MNNKKKLDNETSESGDGSLRTKNFVEIYNENEKEFLIHFLRLQNVKIARLAIQWNPIKVIKKSKRKNQKKITLFLNRFSVGQIDIFSELL